MRSGERGTTYLELLFILGIVGIVSGMAIPALSNAVDRNKIFTGSELVAAAVRHVRLAAIARNTTWAMFLPEGVSYGTVPTQHYGEL